MINRVFVPRFETMEGALGFRKRRGYPLARKEGKHRTSYDPAAAAALEEAKADVIGMGADAQALASPARERPEAWCQKYAAMPAIFDR